MPYFNWARISRAGRGLHLKDSCDFPLQSGENLKALLKLKTKKVACKSRPRVE
jgi:hypothetical protein